VHSVRKHYGIRSDRYKLIHFYGEGKGKDVGNNIDTWEFYDLKNDKHEIKNLYDNPGYSKQIEDMKVRLEKIRKEIKIKE
jgi:arylsulfatase A-like enzyme